MIIYSKIEQNDDEWGGVTQFIAVIMGGGHSISP